MNAAEVAERIGRGKQRRAGSGWSLPCPAHADSSPSLTVSDGREGGVVLHCHAGCSFDDVLSAAGIDPKELGPQKNEGPNDIIAEYRYTDETGSHLFDVVRFAGKRFRQRRPDPTRGSGWNWTLGNIRRPLYRLPEVIKAVQDGCVVFVCEGEKDVEALRRKGVVATCNPGGAGKWKPEHTTCLRGANVVIVADRDDPGRAHARQVSGELSGAAKSISVVESRSGKDAYDHLEAGFGIEEFVALTANAELLLPDIYEFLDEEVSFDWLIEGLLERGDRLMITGGEGSGKSVLLRQIGVCSAAGIHPLRFTPIKPLRVLSVDCENGKLQVQRKFAPLIEQAERSGKQVPKDALFPVVRPSGLDLTTEGDRDWLVDLAVAHKPDIVIIGPLYNLHRANINDELPSRLVASALNDLRIKARCALVVEAHAGHGDPISKERNMRPVGSSLWLRWPEFGYGLCRIKRSDTQKGTNRQGTPVDFTPWRGPREERDWPDSLEHGSPWPWEGRWNRGGQFIGKVPA